MALPSADYELPESNTVIIPKGYKTATYLIVLKPKLFDLTKSYALGVRITASSAGIISGNYSAGVYNLPVKSPWQGKYEVTIDWELPASLSTYSQYFPETLTDVQLSTYGPGIVSGQYIGDLFGGYTYYKFNANGTVGVSFSNTNIKNVQTVESQSDVNSLTFHHITSFTHPSYGDFTLKETYKKTGE